MKLLTFIQIYTATLARLVFEKSKLEYYSFKTILRYLFKRKAFHFKGFTIRIAFFNIFTTQSDVPYSVYM